MEAWVLRNKREVRKGVYDSPEQMGRNISSHRAWKSGTGLFLGYPDRQDTGDGGFKKATPVIVAISPVAPSNRALVEACRKQCRESTGTKRERWTYADSGHPAGKGEDRGESNTAARGELFGGEGDMSCRAFKGGARGIFVIKSLGAKRKICTRGPGR